MSRVDRRSRGDRVREAIGAEHNPGENIADDVRLSRNSKQQTDRKDAEQDGSGDREYWVEVHIELVHGGDANGALQRACGSNHDADNGNGD